jgi:hypothetical protein
MRGGGRASAGSGAGIGREVGQPACVRRDSRRGLSRAHD